MELKVNAKAFQDPESGLIYEIYPIENGKQVMFNLDGVPFKFDQFVLLTSRMGDAISSVSIYVQSLSSQNLEKITEFLALPEVLNVNIEEEENLTVRFDIKQEAIDKFINPVFKNISDLKGFLDIKDDIGGSVVLDFYYYIISNIEVPYLNLIKKPSAV